MEIISIVAASNNNVIGLNNQLPWTLKSDLIRFKNLTTNNIVIMGRKTYESIGKALPKRINIVISRNISFSPKDAIVFDNVENAIKYSQNFSLLKTFIIGGEQIYKETISFVNFIYLTKIHKDVQGDAFFINPEEYGFKIYNESEINTENNLNFQYINYSK